MCTLLLGGTSIAIGGVVVLKSLSLKGPHHVDNKNT